ncbi:MAG: hypothetical protein FWF46_08085 [Oscillospiraceae bacterium]|nr:hypothetical protein [Oscillospiraceae bacterium]
MYGYFDYVSVAELKAKAEKKLKKLMKTNSDIEPIVIEGNKIATTFWGKAWCDNLKTYADYDNRIGRGKSYIKNGFVFDIKIKEGHIEGIVCGSRNNPYNIVINIEPLSKAEQKKLYEKIGKNIDNIENLVQGKFPKELENTFLTKENGLFPNIKEIKMGCNCPDWASMCKHISAVLYGVGAKLDKEPLLLFELRGIDVSELIKKSIDEKMKNMLKNSKIKSERILNDGDINNVFGL